MARIEVGALELRGRADQSLSVGVVQEIHFPINGTEPIVLQGAVRGLEGSIDGWVDTWADASIGLGYIGTMQTITFPSGLSFEAGVVGVEVHPMADGQYGLTFELLGMREA